MKIRLSYLSVLCFIFFNAVDSTLLAQIPTISIHTDQEIVDEPKVPGTFIYTGVDGEIISSNIGIEIRGGFSQTYPKKTYDIEFWNDATGSESIDVKFGSLREDDDWILDAMFNEPLRINSFITHKLWLNLNELYYKDLESNAKSGADVMYVEVSVNDEYQGIYLLSEQIDRSQLKLKRNTDIQIRGELYKGYAWDDAVLFNNPDQTPNNNSLTWSGYEYRYPSEIVDWTNVEELIQFVANSTDQEFTDDIGNRFDIENLMDYFILLNLARILDNRGKNIYLCRYDNDEPYFFAPWDLDGSWGLLWNGENDSTTKDIMTNNLYDRLILNDVDGFRQKLSDKWQSYRISFISDAALENRINEAHQFLSDNGIYEKEGDAWDYEYSETDLDYLFDWLEDRLEFLDDYFEDITSVNDITASTKFDIYPNPTQEYITVTGDFDSSKPVKIYNIFGELIKEENVTQDSRIYLESLNSGLYVLALEDMRYVFSKF